MSVPVCKLCADVSGGFPVKVAIIGGGSFGTAMAVLMARNGHHVSILMREQEVVDSVENDHVNCKFMSHHVLSEKISATMEPSKALKGCSLIIHAIPVQFTLGYLSTFRESIPENVPFVSISKGITQDTNLLMHELLPQILGEHWPTFFLSGPSFAEEIIANLPTAVVLASEKRFTDVAKKVLLWMSNSLFRIYTSTDIVGVNIGGALKNVIAIAAGMLDGLNLGKNAQAMLVTRGNAEITRLAVAMGAKAETMAGIAGMGDMVLTCYGSYSRNRTVGQKLATGMTLKEVLETMSSVAEGVYTTRAAVALAKRYEVKDLPIIEGVNSILEGKSSIQEAVMMICLYRAFFDEF